MLHAELRVTEGKQQGKAVPLNVKKFLIGREQDCQLRPNSDLVSRHHCVFNVDDYTVRLRDLGSTNGTFVNGERIQGQVVLKEGDHVQVGKLSFQLVIRQPAAVADQPTDDYTEAVAATVESDSQVPDGDETMMTNGGTHEFAPVLLDQQAADGDTAVISTDMIPQPDAYPEGYASPQEAYAQEGYPPEGYPAEAYPPQGYPQPDQYAQPMAYPPGAYPPGAYPPGYPPGYPYPPQPMAYPPGYPYPPQPMAYPPGTYPPPMGYPQAYPQPIAYAAPAPAPEAPVEKKSSARTVEAPPLYLPPPEETGAKDAAPAPPPPPPTEAVGEDGKPVAPKVESKKPSLAAADIIRQHMQRRPK